MLKYSNVLPVLEENCQSKMKLAYINLAYDSFKILVSFGKILLIFVYGFLKNSLSFISQFHCF